MLRKCATFALGLVLLTALGSAVAHAHASIPADPSVEFSVPCTPAHQAFKAADQSKPAAKIDCAFAAERCLAPAGAARRAHAATAVSAIPRAAPLTFPPLFHRPPPSFS